MNNECPACGGLTSLRMTRYGSHEFAYRYCANCRRNVSETVVTAQRRERSIVAFLFGALALIALLLGFGGTMLYTAVRFGFGGH